MEPQGSNWQKVGRLFQPITPSAPLGLGLVAIILTAASLPISSKATSEETTGLAGVYGALQFAGVVDIEALPEATLALEGYGEVVASPILLAADETSPLTVNGIPPGKVTGSDALSQPLAPPTISDSFSGLDSAVDAATPVTPPDPQLAVGPNHVLEMVNGSGRVFTKGGTVLSTFTLASFFAVPTGYRHFDVKVIFDAASGRFFATYVSRCNAATGSCGSDEGILHFAVSTTNNPLDPWKRHFFRMANDFPDFPGLGLSDDKVTVSYNRCNIDSFDSALPCFTGVQTLVVQKTDLVDGIESPAIFETLADTTHVTIRPAHSLSSTSVQFMASVTGSSTRTLHLWQISGAPATGDVSVAHGPHLIIEFLVSPPDAEQPGTSNRIATNDNRILETIWRDNRLWIAAHSACIPAEDNITRSCLKLIEVDTATSTVLQDIVYGAAGEYYYYPAIRTDIGGNLHVVFTRSSSSAFAEVRIAGRFSSDPPNTLSESTLMKAGEVTYTSLPFASEPPYRWGDYLGAAVDPSDPLIIWVVGQYAKSDGPVHWGTFIGQLKHPLPQSGNVDCDGDIDAMDVLLILRRIVDLKPFANCLENFGDVNCDDIIDSVDAILILRHIVALPVALPEGCPPLG